ncbi:esterase [Corallococcus coralloides]|nr:esterase [Corallococcus coralloides]
MSTHAKPELTSQDLWVPTSQEHALHVVEARMSGTPDSATGVLFVPGLFSDGRFFLDGQGGGAARTFVDAGCVAYVASLRGHGKSRWPAKRAYDWSFDTYVRHDLPDLVRAVRARHTGPLFLLAHSMAGYAALAALGVDPSLQASLSGVCTLSSAVNDYSDGGFKKRFQLGFSSAVAGLLGRFPAKALKQGPWDEPAGVMRQFTDWAPTGAFRSADGATDYWRELGNVTLPVFAGVGAADVFHASPQRVEKLVAHLGSARKDLFVLGRAQGLSWEAGHFDVVRGERARAEVLPRVLAWMRQVAPAH